MLVNCLTFSITVYVGEEEWMEVGAYVYEHFDDICGVSFLPKEDDYEIPLFLNKDKKETA